jgi:tetratricopeptide (TPR) repeat protein
LVKFLKQPNLDQLEDDLQSNYDMQIGSADPAFVSLNKQEQFTVATFLRGSWHDSLAYLESAWMRTSTQNYQSLNIAMRFLAKAYSGDTEGALKLLEHGPEMVAHLGETNSHGSWALSMASIEGLYVLGERRKVATLYPVARELIDTGTICPLIPARFSQTIAGIAAAAADNWDVAEEHFQTAMRQAESFPSVLEQADIRRFHAMMLMDRAAPEDRERAQALLNDALESYQQVGMSGHIGLTQTLLDRTH